MLLLTTVKLWVIYHTIKCRNLTTRKHNVFKPLAYELNYAIYFEYQNCSSETNFNVIMKVKIWKELRIHTVVLEVKLMIFYI